MQQSQGLHLHVMLLRLPCVLHLPCRDHHQPLAHARNSLCKHDDDVVQNDFAIDATGLIDTGFVDIDALSRADITVRIVGEGGDAMDDPDFTMIHLEFKP